MVLNEYHQYMFQRSNIKDGKFNSKNSSLGCLRMIRLASYRWLLECMSTHTMFPTLNESAASIFPSMVTMIKFWCLRDQEESQRAELIFRKISADTTKKFTSSVFTHHCNRQSLHFNSENATLSISAFVPVLLMAAQAVHENVDDNCIKLHHLFVGGIFNGKAPALKTKKVDSEQTKRTETQKLENTYIYSPNIKKCPTGGVRLLFDNQLEQHLTTKRVGPYDDVEVPINFQFLASMIFNTAGTNAKFPPSYEKTKNKLIKALETSKMPVKDLLPVIAEQAEADEDEDDNMETSKPVNPKIKTETVENFMCHMAERLCNLENAIDEYKQYANSNDDDTNSNSGSEDMILDKDVTAVRGYKYQKTVTALRKYHADLSEVFQESQEVFGKFGEQIKLTNTSSCRSFLVSRKCSEIQATDGLPSSSLIQGYLQLVEKTQHKPRFFYNTPFKLQNLDKIMVNMGLEWNENYMMQASNHGINAESIEKGICSIEFKQQTTVNDVVEAMDGSDVKNVLNIYHAQSHWLDKGWTSNIAHLVNTDKQDYEIKYLIWIEKDTLYQALLNLDGEYDSDNN